MDLIESERDKQFTQAQSEPHAAQQIPVDSDNVNNGGVIPIEPVTFHPDEAANADNHNLTDEEENLTDEDHNFTDEDHNFTDEDHNLTDEDQNWNEEGHNWTDDDHHLTDEDHNLTDEDHNSEGERHGQRNEAAMSSAVTDTSLIHQMGQLAIAENRVVAVSSTTNKKNDGQKEDEWEWWKEEKKPDGVKWNTLTHCGPLFAPPYKPIPDNIKFKYDGKTVKLSPNAEEVATLYARMLDHEYTTKDTFNKNFFRDWRKEMDSTERELITDLKKCDFRQMGTYFKGQSEKRKAMTKEEKLKIKKEKEAETKIYGFAFIDGHKQKVANFKIEPPGLFRGRGGHPKMGMLKRRIHPENVIINCSKNGDIPIPPNEHKWKEVRHDNAVAWLCSWTEGVTGINKYVMLGTSSKIKGEKDYEKYETARRLKDHINNIREVYTADWKSKEMRIRQRAIALYFIDKLVEPLHQAQKVLPRRLHELYEGIRRHLPERANRLLTAVCDIITATSEDFVFVDFESRDVHFLLKTSQRAAECVDQLHNANKESTGGKCIRVTWQKKKTFHDTVQARKKVRDSE